MKTSRHRQQTASHRWTIASYLAPRGFAPRARAALEGLGYRVVPAATRGRFSDDSWQPDLRLADHRHLDRLPRPPDCVPIVAVSDGRPTAGDDPRVVGFVPRPISVASLYPVLQQALEAQPRRVPRAPTRISARCSLEGGRWTAELRSLSELGGQLEARAHLPRGTRLNLLFPLPLGRMISTRAEVVAHASNGTALAFSGHSAAARTAISEYVERRLATL